MFVIAKWSVVVVVRTAMHGHDTTGVIEREHRRGRELAEAAADDVTKRLTRTQEGLKAGILGAVVRAQCVESVDVDGGDHEVGRSAGDGGAERLQPRPDLKGLGPSDDVVAAGDDASESVMLCCREDALEGCEVAGDVGEAQDRATDEPRGRWRGC
jgi:hypothetical protein